MGQRSHLGPRVHFRSRPAVDDGVKIGTPRLQLGARPPLPPQACEVTITETAQARHGEIDPRCARNLAITAPPAGVMHECETDVFLAHAPVVDCVRPPGLRGWRRSAASVFRRHCRRSMSRARTLSDLPKQRSRRHCRGHYGWGRLVGWSRVVIAGRHERDHDHDCGGGQDGLGDLAAIALRHRPPLVGSRSVDAKAVMYGASAKPSTGRMSTSSALRASRSVSLSLKFLHCMSLRSWRNPRSIHGPTEPGRHPSASAISSVVS